MTPPKHCNKFMDEIDADWKMLPTPTRDTEPGIEITAIKYICVVCGHQEWDYLDTPIYR
jgi:hypothetical protein